MKKLILEFLRRGVVSFGFGPLILAVVYLILQHQYGLQTLTISQVCTGIVSLSGLAFIVGGMNAIYQVERLPLMWAILIHGLTLYVSYLITYLFNGWLESGSTPIMVFSVIFVLGYLAISAIIYIVNKKKTEKLNAILKNKHQKHENI